jgi:hypothetical protein
MPCHSDRSRPTPYRTYTPECGLSRTAPSKAFTWGSSHSARAEGRGLLRRTRSGREVTWGETLLAAAQARWSRRRSESTLVWVEDARPKGSPLDLVS